MELGKKKLKTFQQKPVEGGLVWQRGVRRGSTASSLSESFDGEVYELGLECCATSSFTWATVAAETRHLNFLLAERALDWNSTAVGTGAAVKRRLENLKTVAAKMIVKCEMLAHWARSHRQLPAHRNGENGDDVTDVGACWGWSSANGAKYIIICRDIRAIKM